MVSQRDKRQPFACGPRSRAFGPARSAMVLGLGAVILALAADPAWATSGAAAVAGAGPVVQPGTGSGLLEALMFYFIAATTVISVLGICLSKNIVRMAVWLFIALSWVAFLYFLLSAAFLGAVQLIVYVGGTLILLIFGVMLTSKSPWARFEPRRWEWFGAGLVCVALLVTLCVILGRAVWAEAGGPETGVGVADLGRRLLTTYLVPFEVAGVLLMIVMVGAAHLARQDKG